MSHSMEHRAEKRERYRLLILEAAEPIFAYAGFDGAKMQDIAAAAGISLNTLYSVFKGKLELFAALQEERGHALLEAARPLTELVDEPLEMLEAGVRGYLGFLMDHPNFLRIHLFEQDAWALGGRSRTDAQRRQFEFGLRLFADIYRLGLERGIFVEEDPELMAKMIIAQHQVLLADFIKQGRDADRARIIERAIGYLKRLTVR